MFWKLLPEHCFKKKKMFPLITFYVDLLIPRIDKNLTKAIIFYPITVVTVWQTAMSLTISVKLEKHFKICTNQRAHTHILFTILLHACMHACIAWTRYVCEFSQHSTPILYVMNIHDFPVVANIIAIRRPSSIDIMATFSPKIVLSQV